MKIQPLIIGTVAFDTVETPHGTAERALGGSGTYAAFAASFFSSPRLIGVVGEDFPQAHLDLLSSRGVDTGGVERAAGKTFFWHGKYDEDVNQRETLVTELNVLETFKPAIPAGWEDTKYLFLANIDPALQLEVLDMLPETAFTIADTMNLWIDIAAGTLEKVLARVDAVLLNDSEARQLCGTNNLIKAAKDVLKRGPKTVIIKKGEHGVLVFDSEGIFALPAYPLEEVKDPTGAGDSFAGGFIGSLSGAGRLDAGAMRRALAAGTATASLCCEDFSIHRLERADWRQVAERIKAISNMISVDVSPLFN